MKPILKRAWAAWLLMPVLLSCASYNKSMDAYYANIKEHNYTKAMRSLEKNKLIKKDRNALLYNLEAGKLYRLQNDYAKSNIYLNRADNMMESNRKSLSDIALGNLVNPMHTAYRGEDFEQFMMHYYKALNYASLGQMEDAVVEARRITLSSDAQGDKFKNKDSRYSKDAFALNLQGMIYDMAGDMNNAFISYRNAAEIYEKAGDEYYGVKMPQQLQKDLIRTAALMGFAGDQEMYERKYGIAYAANADSASELILFLEEGQAPVKEEKDFFLTTNSNGLGSFNYVDATGLNSNFNFNYSAYGISESKLSSLRMWRVALPQYVVQYAQPKSIVVTTGNGFSYNPQLAEDLNNVATNILKERFLTEMANALARQITKKVVEKGTQTVAESIAKSNDKKADSTANETEKQKQQEKRQENAKQAGEIAGLLVNLVNTATEKADTRNWQSLPAYVSYVRIPLAAGENTITVSSNGNPVTLKVTGKKGIQMMGVNVD
jgi:hypothetical protein